MKQQDAAGCTSGLTRRNNPAPTWCADQAFKESLIALKLSTGVSDRLQHRSSHAPFHTHTQTLGDTEVTARHNGIVLSVLTVLWCANKNCWRKGISSELNHTWFGYPSTIHPSTIHPSTVHHPSTIHPIIHPFILWGSWLVPVDIGREAAYKSNYTEWTKRLKTNTTVLLIDSSCVWMGTAVIKFKPQETDREKSPSLLLTGTLVPFYFHFINENKARRGKKSRVSFPHNNDWRGKSSETKVRSLTHYQLIRTREIKISSSAQAR